MILSQIHHLRCCFELLVTAAYETVRLIPRSSRALHLEHLQQDHSL